jgi:cysteine synthase B
MENDDSQMKIGTPLPDRIGKTPLIRLEQAVRGLDGITLLGKAEWANPGGSVKDRAAAGMVRDALQRGLLTPAPVELAMPSNVSPERKRILGAFGAKIEWTDPGLGPDGAIRRAREMAGNDPERYCYLDQYSNDANWLAHFHTTGPEIWEQSAGKVTHFVAGVGTSGTLMGTARRLKGYNAALKAVAVHPDSPFHGIEGLKFMGDSIVPPIYNPHLANASVEVGTEEACEMVKRMAREEGLLVGISSGAAIAASVRIAREEAAAGRTAVIVAMLPDSAEKYLSERFWEEA